MLANIYIIIWFTASLVLGNNINWESVYYWYINPGLVKGMERIFVFTLILFITLSVLLSSLFMIDVIRGLIWGQ